MSDIKDKILNRIVEVASILLLWPLYRLFGYLLSKIPTISNLFQKQELLKLFITAIFYLLVFIAYAIYLHHQTKAKILSRQEQEDIQRKKLGAFLLDEIERLKKERETLFPATPLSQLKEEHRFLDGQEEVLLHLSQWLKPPEK